MVLKPSFPADELTIAKRSFASEMTARRSTATAAATDLVVAVLMGSERPIVASPEAFAKLSADQLAAWHRERYVPQNAVLSVVGDVDPEAVERTVRAAFAGWARTNFTESPPPLKHPGQRAIHFLDRPGSVQTALMVGGPAASRADADYPALFVGNTVLGSPQGGRLTRALREARGWSYNPQGGLLTYKQGGCWLNYGDVSTPRTGDALTVFLDEVRRLAAEPVSSQELDDAKRSAVGQFALGLESLQALASFMAVRMVEGLSADYWERFPDVMQAVTADDVRRVAAKYMDPAKAQIVAVGDREQVLPLLAPFGGIVIYDADGKPVPAK
jgi:predicted Zn-dependent peptidase